MLDVIVPSLLLAAAADPITGVQQGWGLTPEELVSQNSGKIVATPPTDRRVYNLRPGALAQTPTLDLLFLFTPISRRLAAIQVSPRDMKNCNDWLSELRETLGAPYAANADRWGISVTADWVDSTTNYHFEGAGPGKHMKCLLNLTPVQPLPERG